MPSMSFLNTAKAAVLLSTAVHGFIVGCGSRLYDQRIDPIINPNAPSGHVHTVVGGNAMNFTMNGTLANRATCTTCAVVEDKSNYWTPKLYYYNTTNGQFTAVAQSGDTKPTGSGSLSGQKVYYLQRGGPNNDNLTAFPPGFRMVAGDPFKRNYTGDYAAQAISFACLDYSGNTSHGDTNYLPDYNCASGIRAQVFFPQCWDGKNLDSPNHRDHVAYPDPTKQGAYNTGSCPSTHPVHLVSIFYEVFYDTQDFANYWYTGKNPFVFAQGDPTGYGFHGDFVNGWDVPTLQKSLNGGCDGGGADSSTCSYFTQNSAQSSCSIPISIDEDVYGPFNQLPGCNPIQAGPAYATNYGPGCNRTGAIGPYKTYYTDLTSTGWKYDGCAPDNGTDRTFNSGLNYNNTETLEMCNAFCANRGYKYAGAEYSTQCYCANSLRSDRMPVAGLLSPCNMKCGGNSNEYCGGSNALTVYEKCTDTASCVNAKYQPIQ